MGGAGGGEGVRGGVELCRRTGIGAGVRRGDGWGGVFWVIGMGVAAYGVDIFLGVLVFGYGHCGLQGGHLHGSFDVLDMGHCDGHCGLRGGHLHGSREHRDGFSGR